MIVVSEWLDDYGLDLLSQLPIKHVYNPDLWSSVGALHNELHGARALIIRNQTRVDGDLLDAAPRLQVIGRLGVGLDNIDVNACQAHRVVIVYARGANAPAVVEYVLGALLHSMRPWLDWSTNTKSGAWSRRLGGREIYGKTLGVVGLGDIGSRVARAARALGMNVEAYDPHLAPFHSLIADGTVTPIATMEELLQRADAITLHASLRPETYHLLNHQTLSYIQPGSILINTARGSLIDEAALVQQLQDQRLGPVYLDVREVEPPPLPDPLARYAQVHLTPHLAGLSQESRLRTTTLVLEDVVRVLTDRPARSPVRWTH
ncbi:MAG: phosphoglycerate dehydrogenase [Sulfobacillus acidophilus]|uniref:Phosphoglycerate dehydrogenase n=1 Tax=Sulfobacillus acidophilus TaxID=53633 RepID=A0A2T2WM90_9FIRM|nr:MAG: phosphoglycerate dehydrogenase [Sulfobacillus acidophilus]